MKKLTVALALLLMLGVVADVYATNTNPPIPGGATIKMKYVNNGSFYRDGVPLDNPGGVFIALDAGDELRNTYNATQFFNQTSPTPNIPFWNTSLSQQISGLVYDLTVAVDIPEIPPYNPTAPNVLYLMDNARNPSPGLAAWQAINPAIDSMNVCGGRFDMYIDGNGVLNASLASNYDSYLANGPGDWNEAAGYDTFPTINEDGEELFLECVLIPFPDPAVAGAVDPVNNPLGLTEGIVPDGTLMREVAVVDSAEQGNGRFYLMIVGGSGQYLFTPGGYNAQYISEGGYNGTFAMPPGVTADIFVSFNDGPNNTDLGAPPWGVWSEDPALVRTVLIPEPLTMLGLLLGGTGLTGYLRRRRMA